MHGNLRPPTGRKKTRGATSAGCRDDGPDTDDEATSFSVRLETGIADKHVGPEWMRAFRNFGFTPSPKEEAEMKLKDWTLPKPEQDSEEQKAKMEGWPWSMRKSVNTQYAPEATQCPTHITPHTRTASLTASPPH